MPWSAWMDGGEDSLICSVLSTYAGRGYSYCDFAVHYYFDDESYDPPSDSGAVNTSTMASVGIEPMRSGTGMYAFTGEYEAFQGSATGHGFSHYPGNYYMATLSQSLSREWQRDQSEDNANHNWVLTDNYRLHCKQMIFVFTAPTEALVYPSDADVMRGYQFESSSPIGFRWADWNITVESNLGIYTDPGSSIIGDTSQVLYDITYIQGNATDPGIFESVDEDGWAWPRPSDGTSAGTLTPLSSTNGTTSTQTFLLSDIVPDGVTEFSLVISPRQIKPGEGALPYMLSNQPGPMPWAPGVNPNLGLSGGHTTTISSMWTTVKFNQYTSSAFAYALMPRYREWIEVPLTNPFDVPLPFTFVDDPVDYPIGDYPVDEYPIGTYALGGTALVADCYAYVYEGDVIA